MLTVTRDDHFEGLQKRVAREQIGRMDGEVQGRDELRISGSRQGLLS